MAVATVGAFNAPKTLNSESLRPQEQPPSKRRTQNSQMNEKSRSANLLQFYSDSHSSGAKPCSQ